MHVYALYGKGRLILAALFLVIMGMLGFGFVSSLLHVLTIDFPIVKPVSALPSSLWHIFIYYVDWAMRVLAYFTTTPCTSSAFIPYTGLYVGVAFIC